MRKFAFATDLINLTNLRCDKSMETSTTFLDTLAEQIRRDTFLKLTLSKPTQEAGDLKNVYGRLLLVKGVLHLSFTLRYATRDEVKNYGIPEALLQIDAWLGELFLQATLFSAEADTILTINRKRKARVYQKAPSMSERKPLVHDHQKKRHVEGAHYLHALGISDEKGQVLKSGQKKYRQINRYIEILEHQFRQIELPEKPVIIDMGSGKGYLTFSLYDYLSNNGYQPEMYGVELREHLVESCNVIAGDSGFGSLHFEASDINQFAVAKADVLIALHACDTATDLAIAKGIRAGASMIVVAPCCQQQLRQNMTGGEGALAGEILKHGILMERQAELLTDGIRAMLMESRGYATKVFEFISLEHTAKNLMIVGVKTGQMRDISRELAEIKQQFGISEHFLETLLEGTLLS